MRREETPPGAPGCGCCASPSGCCVAAGKGEWDSREGRGHTALQELRRRGASSGGRWSPRGKSAPRPDARVGQATGLQQVVAAARLGYHAAAIQVPRRTSPAQPRADFSPRSSGPRLGWWAGGPPVVNRWPVGRWPLKCGPGRTQTTSAPVSLIRQGEQPQQIYKWGGDVSPTMAGD